MTLVRHGFEAAVAGPGQLASGSAKFEIPFATELTPGRKQLDEYFALRASAEAYKSPIDGERMADIQQTARDWLAVTEPEILEPGTVEDYTTYDYARIKRRYSGLADALSYKYPHDIHRMEAIATDSFVDAAFGMWRGKDASVTPDLQDGSFAFVVPPRVSKKNPEYGRELEDLIHVMRYVPTDLRAAMLRGVPPWVVDTYKKDENGKRGYLICAPVTGDMEADLSATSVGGMLTAAREVVNGAVDLAADGLGVWAIGFGATFPRLMRYGTETRRDDVVTTTGHGGTVVQIANVIDAYIKNGLGNRIGVIGLGAIGAPAAEVIGQLYPDGAISLYDTRPNAAAKLADRDPKRFRVAESLAHLIKESDIIVSAVTEPVPLRMLGITSMKGKGVVDDSQPACFDTAEVEALGGINAWPIGFDHSGRVVREYCSYGDLMVDGLQDLFGCEAEVASLAAARARFEAKGVPPEQALSMVRDMAIRGPVTAGQVLKIRELFHQAGIGRATLQSAGRLSIIANAETN